MTMAQSNDGVAELARRIVRFGESTVKRLPRTSHWWINAVSHNNQKNANRARLHDKMKKAQINSKTLLFLSTF